MSDIPPPGLAMSDISNLDPGSLYLTSLISLSDISHLPPDATSQTYVITTATMAATGYYICEVKEYFTGDVYWSSPAKLEVLCEYDTSW